MSKTIVRNFSIDMYRYKFNYIKSKTVYKALKDSGYLENYIEEYGGDRESLKHLLSQYDGIFIKFKKIGVNCIFVEDKAPVSVISHECLHLVIDMLSSAGLFLEDASEEAYCYSMSAVMELVLNEKR